MASVKDAFKPLIANETTKPPAGIQSKIVESCARDPPPFDSSPLFVVNYLQDIDAEAQISRLRQRNAKLSVPINMDYAKLPTGGYNLVIFCHGADNDQQDSLEKRLLFINYRVLPILISY